MLRLLDTKAPPPPGSPEALVDEIRGDTGGPKIRCPKCGWRPRKEDRWGCACGHAWNTFDTAGRCPACGHQWEVTQCLSCHRFSKHAEWYERAPE